MNLSLHQPWSSNYLTFYNYEFTATSTINLQFLLVYNYTIKQISQWIYRYFYYVFNL